MSDEPVEPTPPPTPPPQTVAYPRGTVVVYPGSADKLQALGDAYFSLNMVFLITVAILVFVRLSSAMSAAGNPEMSDPAYRLGFNLAPFLMAAVVAMIVSYKPLQKAAFGMGWNLRTPVWLCIVLGLQTFICCGAFGIGIVQHLLVGEMNKYGIKGRVVGGIRKDQIGAVVAQMRAQEGAPPFSG